MKPLAVVLIIAVLFCMYMAYVRVRRDRLYAKIDKLLQNSSGTFDEPAAQALDMLNAMDDRGELTGEGHARRADIIRTNIAEENPVEMDPLMEEIVLDYFAALAENPRNDVIHHAGNLPDVPIVTAANNANIVAARTRARNAQSRTRTSADAVADFFRPDVRADSQNSHDSCVNIAMRDILAKMRGVDSTCADSTAGSINQMRAYIRSKPYCAGQVNAMKTLDVIAVGNSHSQMGMREDDIFSLVFRRASLPQNAQQQENMREALFNALADSTEAGTTVCINGRISRMLGSLAALDYDDKMSTMVTYDAYRTQIFSETRDIIDKNISREGTLETNTANNYFTGGDVEISADVKAKIVEKIDENINKYSGKLTPSDISRIREECIVAVDML